MLVLVSCVSWEIITDDLQTAECTDTSTDTTADLTTDEVPSVNHANDILMEYTSVTMGNRDSTIFRANDLALNGTADPCILPVKEDDGRLCFYLYSTMFHCYYSYDLTNWVSIPNITTKEANTWQNADWWAPEVIYDEEADLYRMFYSASSKQGYFYITMSTSKSPKGPFVQWTGVNADGLEIGADTPIYDFSRMDKEHPLYEGVIRAIDVSPFIDPETGDKYLYWCRGWNAGGTIVHSTSEVWGMKMKDWETPDYSTVTRLTEVNRVTPGGAVKTGETSINEGPCMLYKDGTYFLTFSINPASDKAYSVWQATSDAPLGTFTKISQNKGGMILGVDSRWSHVSGTGHHCFFTLDDEIYIVYHAHKYKKFTTYSDRALAIDRVVWTTNEGGDTILHANGPSYSPMSLPSVISGYENIAPTATVTASGADDMTVYLTDGIINMHNYANQPEAEFTETTTITLRWDDYRSVKELLLFNTTYSKKAFDTIERIEFDCRAADGTEETRVIRDAEFLMDKYKIKYAASSYILPGAALILELAENTDVNEIRITVSLPAEHDSVAISEIEVLAQVQ